MIPLQISHTIEFIVICIVLLRDLVLFIDLLSLRLVGAVGVKSYVRNSAYPVVLPLWLREFTAYSFEPELMIFRS